ncbi:MAG: DNA-binding protein [Flavobacteriaceae bacterium]|nr:DNA-binding protein [Flavobacteriaceae bacterium]
MISISIKSRKNPQDPLAPEKFYVQTKKDGLTDLERLAYLISNQSTVREPDCLAVLSALVHNMMDEMAQGRVVQLGILGNFQVGVKSEGSETLEEVTISNVKSAHINYRPGRRVKDALKVMKFKLIGG